MTNDQQFKLSPLQLLILDPCIFTECAEDYGTKKWPTIEDRSVSKLG